MKPALLIAANFLRQHRWPVLILFAWIVLTAFAAGDFGRSRPVGEDVIFYAQQQAIYICIFSAFLAADAIHGERKSRRILLLLSKAVSRAQYLFAILAATWVIALAYSVVFAFCTVWLTARAMMSTAELWPFVVLVMAGVTIAATVAIFFSTLVNPYVATALTLALFCVPAAWHTYRHSWSVWLPGFPILVQFLKFRFRPDWGMSWTTIIAAIVQSVVIWSLAAAVFNRRDIAVPVE